jgi:hypothetical protein
VARWRDQIDPVPDRLARFVAAEWPGSMHEATAAWGDACLAWLAERPGRVLPCALDGSPVDVRAEVVRLRREIARGRP